MNNINVTIELCAEDRARLDALRAALDNKYNCKDCVALVTEMFDNLAKGTTASGTAQNSPKIEPQTKENPKAEELPAEKENAPKQATEPQEAAVKSVSRDEVQSKVVSLCAAGKKAEVKALVNKYAERVGAIPEEKLAEVYEQLGALEG